MENDFGLFIIAVLLVGFGYLIRYLQTRKKK